MRKAFYSIIIILVLCLALVACKDNKVVKQAKTIEIKTVTDLESINDYLGDEFSLYEFVLMNDLDLAETSWTPIGYDNKNSFRATFDGNGKTISNLTVKGYDTAEKQFIEKIPYEYVGLFGYIYNATIKDLGLENFNISFFGEHDETHVGGLIGYAYGDNIIENISVNGQINMGTTFHFVQKVVLELTCNQTQYIGGIFGFSSGNMLLKNSLSNVTINNLVAARGPKINYSTDELVYEKDKKGNDTKTPEMDIMLEFYDPSCFPLQAFAGSIGGYSKGRESIFDSVQGKSNVSSFYSRSAYLGGLFGVIYNSKITDSEYEGILQTNVYIKGVSGGIAGLIDKTVLANSTVKDSTITLGIVSGQYQSYTSGGLVGYANDFSSIEDCQVIDTKILSDLPNKKENSTETQNYPVIGGIAGTVRDSAVTDCDAVRGGVFRSNLTDIDNTFIFSAGMVADVYGNSIIKKCKSSFKAYAGAVAKYSETIYIEENGKQILRFVKEGLPSVYLGADAYVEGDILVVNFINDAQEIVATYKYNDFIGNDMEEYLQNYYDEEQNCLVDAEGKIIKVDGRNMQNYIRLTGNCYFEELDYLHDSIIPNGNNVHDEDLGEGWFRFQL